MGTWLSGLAAQHKDLSSDLQHPHKARHDPNACNPVPIGQRQIDPGSSLAG